jgi:hypothetical protein
MPIDVWRLDQDFAEVMQLEQLAGLNDFSRWALTQCELNGTNQIIISEA